jgi:hypothetical protein
MEKNQMPEEQKELRKNIYLPVIEDEEEKLKFAKGLTDLMMSMFDTGGNGDAYLEQEIGMLYHAIVLLMSYSKRQRLKQVLLCYIDPEFTKRRMQQLRNREIFDYWQIQVPKFMTEQKGIAKLLRHFFVNVALLVGEDAVQDYCKNYGKER